MNPRIGFALVVLASGCGSDGGSDDQAGTDPTSSSSASAGSLETSATTATTTAGTTTPGESSSSGDATSNPTSSSSADSSSDDGATTGPPDANGCPADAPSSWVGCEDFDGIDDPASQIPQWNVYEDAFGVEADGDDPSDLALRITLTPGLQFGGWVTLRWGDGPVGGVVDSPDAQLDEVWVRYSLRTGDDWPGYEIGDVGEVIAMNGPDWAIAAEMAIRGDANGRLHPLGWTCIFDGVLACNGNNEWSGALQLIWQEQGTGTFFDAAGAGQSRCVEAYMRLNTPGAADGEAQVWVDGVQEIGTDGVDFRESWSEFGINALRFTNFAEPPSEPLDFWVDDVVIATERVGCD
ncbi:MAG: hypothetical protein IAG13_28270 [Deltaproteobacteria bacterium]|nr:hypothetical protein [Nannocystaceae bacterium]